MPYKDRAKQRAYQLRWVHRKRSAWLDKHGPCVLCGSTSELQVDHIDPKSKVSHRVWSWTLVRRERELKKCQVLCKSCHKIKSDREQTKPLVHGTSNGYGPKRCRCRKCRDWRRDYMRMQRAKT